MFLYVNLQIKEKSAITVFSQNDFYMGIFTVYPVVICT